MSKQYICNKCGTESPSDSKFCGSCGQPFAVSQTTAAQIDGQAVQAESANSRQWPGRAVSMTLCLGAIALMVATWNWRDISQTGKLLFWLSSTVAVTGSFLACKLWAKQASNRRLATSGLGAVVVYVSLFAVGHLLLPSQQMAVVDINERTANTKDVEKVPQESPPVTTKKIATAESPYGRAQEQPLAPSPKKPAANNEVIGDPVSESDEPIDLDIDLNEPQSTKLAGTPTPSHGQNDVKIEQPMPLDPVVIDPPAQPMKATADVTADVKFQMLIKAGQEEKAYRLYKQVNQLQKLSFETHYLGTLLSTKFENQDERNRLAEQLRKNFPSEPLAHFADAVVSNRWFHLNPSPQEARYAAELAQKLNSFRTQLYQKGVRFYGQKALVLAGIHFRNFYRAAGPHPIPDESAYYKAMLLTTDPYFPSSGPGVVRTTRPSADALRSVEEMKEYLRTYLNEQPNGRFAYEARELLDRYSANN